MRTALRICATLFVLSFVPPLHAQDELKPLQGRWVVTGGEHNGKPMDSLKGGVMTIAGTAFEVRTASGNMLKGTLRVDTSTRPFEMDLLHADGGRWEAIYSVDGDVLTLNPELRYIINPGSVGQPRDRDARAAYAIYDSEANTVSFRRAAYAITKTQQQIRDVGLPELLGDRLSFGM